MGTEGWEPRLAAHAAGESAFKFTRPEPDPMPEGLIDLAKMCADLEGFIERRAAELAKPAIEEAERSALASDHRVADLQEEFGRQLRALDRQLTEARRWADELLKERDRLAQRLREVRADGPEVTPEFREQVAGLMDRNDGLMRRLAGTEDVTDR